MQLYEYAISNGPGTLLRHGTVRTLVGLEVLAVWAATKGYTMIFGPAPAESEA